MKPAPYVSAATACAPPTAITRSTPAMSAAAITASFRFFVGGVTMIISSTPATRAGTAFIRTDEGYAAAPPGT